jgi:hypothetical protein
MRCVGATAYLGVPQSEAKAMTDDEFFEHQRSTSNRLVTKVNSVRKDTAATRVVELLMKRIVSGGNTLSYLRERSSRHPEYDCTLDGATILRGIYDAMLQALYVLHDPSACEERAQLYLDFYWVERWEAIGLFDKSPTTLAAKVKGSPKRLQAEPAIKERFEHVKATFLTRRGGLHDVWYRGKLRDLARAVDLEAEYELLQRQLSGAVHSSPLFLKDGPAYDGFLLLDLCWRFSFRVLGKFAEYKGVGLDQFEKELIKNSGRNIFDFAVA